MIRVLVVDDSATARERTIAVLNSAPEIDVVGVAADGLEGVDLALRLKPDVITMDINMPRMDGHEATRRIMEMLPTPIVVVISVTRQEMVHKGLDILLVGAVEIVQKPSAPADHGHEAMSEELITKVRSVSEIKLRNARM
jgi:two-component system chemotaxis response regulator CheB